MSINPEQFAAANKAAVDSLLSVVRCQYRPGLR